MKDILKVVLRFLPIRSKENNVRLTPQEVEHMELSENMRHQFLSLKKKGLPIRIVAL